MLNDNITFQARVPNVRQAKETRPNPLDPRFARGQRPNPHHRLRLQPRPHWNLWHIQEQRKARSIVNYFIQKSKQNFIISAISEQNQEEQNLSVVGRLRAYQPDGQKWYGNYYIVFIPKIILLGRVNTYILWIQNSFKETHNYCRKFSQTMHLHLNEVGRISSIL